MNAVARFFHEPEGLIFHGSALLYGGNAVSFLNAF